MAQQEHLLIAEEFYQISGEMINSFPKYRLPLALFRYHEDVAQLQPYTAREQRLSNEQIEEIQELCKEGLLFVSRDDYPIYSQHIIKQLDLILVDKHLKPLEIGHICVRALSARLQAYLEQPVKIVGDQLIENTMVVTEYLQNDPVQIKAFLPHLSREHSLISHSLNTFIIGLWLLITTNKTLQPKELNRFALGLLLHDAGMSKIPSFILTKTSMLTPEEKDKILAHALLGAKMVQKMELGWDELVSAALDHHERLDGSGYPRKLAGENISKIGRIAAIADSFAAMISNRPYAQIKDPLTAAQELANDTKRYDARYTAPLRNALLLKEIVIPDLEEKK